ncbi:M28 family peptidase [uncultured Microscilla sp.]|uniref:M28 family peptidase n=1 Tax=uncultured Microscilla sp. TaxID=432653 RepID=UPI002632C8A3|nr:M28 family peptidase [uncultured Microscilla sp.]
MSMHAIPVSKERLYADVQKLTSVYPPRNYQNLESLNAIAHYIHEEYKKWDCLTEVQTYDAEGNTYQNLIASFGVGYNTRIVLGAHYDVCGDQPGADDNASAVAGLLEVGRLIDQLQPSLNCRVDLVAYTLEEPPFFQTPLQGSAVHARSMSQNKVDIKAMICLEMIGYYSDKPNSQQFPIPELAAIYPSVGNFIVVVGKTGEETLVQEVKTSMKQVANIDVQAINAPPQMVGITFSDHASYWNEGYPAVMINNTSFYRNPHYHETTDTIDTLDFDKMTEVVRGVYQAVVNLA